MKRKSLTRLQRVRIFDRAGGKCCICGLKIHAERGEKWEPHHVRPLWLGGKDEFWNMAPAHAKPCHSDVSAADNTPRAKTDRQRANHLGIPKPSKAKFPAGRSSRQRKKISGEVVERVSGTQQHHALMTRLGRPSNVAR